MDWLDPAHQQELYDALIPSARAAGLIEIGKGFIWTLGGALLSGFTYQAASVDGGTYFIFWGAMLYGVIRMLRGLFYVVFPKALINRAIRDS